MHILGSGDTSRAATAALRIARASVFTALAIFALIPTPTRATDTDGPNDCTRGGKDFGDAPESLLAYPGVTGAFPTCFSPGPTGTQESVCTPISTTPGAAGYVRHDFFPFAADGGYWLGCAPGSPLGLDSENDGKVNDDGTGTSACDDTISVDCFQTSLGINYGQDECVGSDDAGLGLGSVFAACSLGVVGFRAYNCAPGTRDVMLNVLVDWNQDGDWNDNVDCGGGVCAYEWAVKNLTVTLPAGCGNVLSPAFQTGPATGIAWTRITISDLSVPDDFPWNGTASMAPFGNTRNGETEDYPLLIRPQITSNPCRVGYTDYGDAPEEITALPSHTGHYPTCTFVSTAGTQESACTALSTSPGLTGFVRHVAAPGDPDKFWLGCAIPGVDAESDGKLNADPTPGTASVCDGAVLTDCAETAFLTFGQDECYGDGVDAGVTGVANFTACGTSSVTFQAYSCGAAARDVVLNILVDGNEDADWNDNFDCGGACAYEWAIKNQTITLEPGCSSHTVSFLAGPDVGDGWMRITLTEASVPDDFPWNGSAGLPSQQFNNGETEDYPIQIFYGSDDPRESGYQDFGDAPQGIAAYPSGVTGSFPTCSPGVAGAGTANIACAPLSTAPGATAGYVKHDVGAGLARYFWLGLGLLDPVGVDTDGNGKVNASATAGDPSQCDAAVATDCVETVFGGSTFGQDECYAELSEPGIASPVEMVACSTSTVTFRTYLTTAASHDVNLNVLVDFNEDGDWNDNFVCAGGTCAYEWAVKNQVLTLPGGSGTHTVSFLAGPDSGRGWMRITLTDVPVMDDFPWNGSLGEATGSYVIGETEDYPVTIRMPASQVCVSPWHDFGDAPEDVIALPGSVLGAYPTCTSAGPVAMEQLATAPRHSGPVGPAGHVEHFADDGMWVDDFWLGPAPGLMSGGVDSEMNGKVSGQMPSPRLGPAVAPSACDPMVATDCDESVPGVMTLFGQDECYGDGMEAGMASPVSFTACSQGMVTLQAWSCSALPVEVYFNVAVDWNKDGDWVDNFDCMGTFAHEWSLKNQMITLPPGASMQMASFPTGPDTGAAWMRVSLTLDPVPDDYPWNGSLSAPMGRFRGGETEDYPVRIRESDPCALAWQDFGDAPEGITAYPNGTMGSFPTCLQVAAASTQVVECGSALSTAPGAAGYVRHVALPSDPTHFWLGDLLPVGQVDSEPDGKVNGSPLPGTPSACAPAVLTDCVESFGGSSFGQDECLGDGDIGLVYTNAVACSLSSFWAQVGGCGDERLAYFNMLVDWSGDGDWNDVVDCPGPECAPEWIAKNIGFTAGSGLQGFTWSVYAGPRAGPAWLRVSVSAEPAPDDYPWNGSTGLPGGVFHGGETEDYLINIRSSPVGVDREPIARGLQLSIHPNPALDGTTARFSLPRAAQVKLGVYDIGGRRLASLVDGPMGAGEHSVPWDFTTDDGRRVPVGVYVVRLEVQNVVLARNAVRLR